MVQGAIDVYDYHVRKHAEAKKAGKVNNLTDMEYLGMVMAGTIATQVNKESQNSSSGQSSSRNTALARRQ